MPQLPAIQWGLIAGIHDHGGGRRVVFTSDPTSVAANTMRGEKAFPVPGLHPMTDIWGHKEWIVWKGDQAVLDATRPGCGACRACCITLYIAPDENGFTKPSHTPCQNLCNDGCGVNATKPALCARFKCLWLDSQDGNRAMAPELRPDRCGVILTRDPDDTIRPHIDQSYPKSEAMQAFISAREAEGERFETVTHYTGEPT